MTSRTEPEAHTSLGFQEFRGRYRGYQKPFPRTPSRTQNPSEPAGPGLTWTVRGSTKSRDPQYLETHRRPRICGFQVSRHPSDLRGPPTQGIQHQREKDFFAIGYILLASGNKIRRLVSGHAGTTYWAVFLCRCAARRGVMLTHAAPRQYSSKPLD